MIERIEINQIKTGEVPESPVTEHEHPLVEGLVQKLGVPADRVENMVRVWEKLLGERMVDFLKDKVATKNNPKA